MAMMVPDYGLIGEISFYAFGFEKGRHLAKKMVTTFQLCSEQLSAQSHYATGNDLFLIVFLIVFLIEFNWIQLMSKDYGMRAVKTVIEAAGLNKRQYPEQSERGAHGREDTGIVKPSRRDLQMLLEFKRKDNWFKYV